MFQAKSLLFLYCVSPVHPGAGTSLGAVDNPVQRERHTDHPTMAGSGIKGALREHCGGVNGEEVAMVFGPDPGNSSAHAGAVSLSDAQVVLFPVRDPRTAFVYTTSPTALARLQRLATLAGIAEVDSWRIPSPSSGQYVPLGGEGERRLLLESFEFEREAAPDGSTGIAEFLSSRCLPARVGWADFFRDKIARDTVVLADEAFTYFTRNATLVEPHVRIDDITGTAEEGGLFYVENLPPETLMVSLAMASRSRKQGNEMEARDVLDLVRGWIEKESMIQMGGDSTTGRGHVIVRFVGKEE